MRFGFSTYFFMQKPIGQIVDELVEKGVTTIELSYELPHVLTMDDAFIEKAKWLRQKGVEFSMHGPFFEINLGSYIDEVRRVSKERYMNAVVMAARIGCDPLVVHPGYSFMINRVAELEDRLRAQFIEDLRDITVFARKQGVRIALENIHMSYFFFCDLEEFPELQRLAPGIGLTLDIGHAYITKYTRESSDPEGEILDDIKAIGIENLWHVHLHSNMGEKDDHMFLEGPVDMRRFVHGLRDLGYDGKVIVESFEMEEHGIDPALAKLNSLRV